MAHLQSSSRSQGEAEAAAGTALLEVISHLVHELRTPLTVIAGYAALLGESGSEPAPADFVDAIARNATVIQRRLDLLADTEEVLRGRLKLDREPCDLGELVEDVVHGYSPELAHNPVRIEVLIDDTVSVDRRRLAQAVGHLVGNAARFSPAHAAIDIRVASEAGGATITVRDHGPGVPEHLRPLLFRRFAETGPGRKSTGLVSSSPGRSWRYTAARSSTSRHPAGARPSPSCFRGRTRRCCTRMRRRRTETATDEAALIARRLPTWAVVGLSGSLR